MALDRNGRPIKYGPCKKEDTAPSLSIPMASTQYIPAGGAFVTITSGNATIAGDGSTLLAGLVFPGEVGLDAGKMYQTGSSTAAATVCPFLPISAMLNVVVRLPVYSGTFTAAMRGKTCDIAIITASKLQGVQLDASSEDTVIIVDGDLVNNAWVDVVVNPDKIASLTGVV